jgi:type I restriction enzyme M protein
MANGAMTSNNNNENIIRAAIVEDDLVECMVALPPKLFINTQIPSCLFFLNKKKKNKGKTLFIDARHLGYLETAAQRVFDEEDIAKIADTYHAWAETGETEEKYKCILGFCKAVDKTDIAAQGYNLSPGRYVGAAEVEEDEAEFDEEMTMLTAALSGQIIKSVKLDSEIKTSLKEVGYDI